ncbi:uncharacterized protein G2W53_011589 [Senna tora]|nr:uncharacterized protein G2W53_011589 [Senna tora]
MDSFTLQNPIHDNSRSSFNSTTTHDYQESD